jgi:hypothetical protein
MKRFSVFHPLFLSFYSKPLYQDVAKNWKGGGFLSLLIVLVLTWIPVMITVNAEVGAFLDREAPKYINQVPKISVEKGEARVDVPTMPYSIIDPSSGMELMVIDTTGRITSLEQTPALSLLTKTKFMMRQEQRNEIRVFDLAAFEGLTLDSGRVNGWVQAFKSGFAIIAYPFAVAGSYLYRIVQALIYALIALIFARVLKVSLEYGALLQLALVAITPVLLLNTLRTVLGVPVPFAGLISFIVALGYLFLAVKANAGNGSASA